MDQKERMLANLPYKSWMDGLSEDRMECKKKLYKYNNLPPEETAERELCEETGVTGYRLRLVGVYSRPGRDPRGWTVSAAYSAVVDACRINAEAGDDAESVQWVPVEKDNSGDMHLACDEPLAFDHAEIISDAIDIMLK